jgi:seryl-tRNA synthetase
MSSSFTEIIFEIQLSFKEFMSSYESIKLDLEHIKKEIKKLNNSKPNDKILSQYQNIERSYNNLKRNYKKSKKEYEDYLKKFQDFAQSKIKIDDPKYNKLRDSYKVFKKDRESDLEEFKKISTQYKSRTVKMELSSSRELSRVSNYHQDKSNLPSKRSKLKSIFDCFTRIFFRSKNLASQDKSISLSQNICRDASEESKKESHVIIIF